MLVLCFSPSDSFDQPMHPIPSAHSSPSNVSVSFSGHCPSQLELLCLHTHGVVSASLGQPLADGCWSTQEYASPDRSLPQDGTTPGHHLHSRVSCKVRLKPLSMGLCLKYPLAWPLSLPWPDSSNLLQFHLGVFLIKSLACLFSPQDVLLGHWPKAYHQENFQNIKEIRLFQPVRLASTKVYRMVDCDLGMGRVGASV